MKAAVIDPAFRLSNLAKLYQKRDLSYGPAIKKTGRVMECLMDGQLDGYYQAEDFSRLFILSTIINKLCRYANNFAYGGHSDSLDDIAVYCAILNELDEAMNHRTNFEVKESYIDQDGHHHHAVPIHHTDSTYQYHDYRESDEAYAAATTQNEQAYSS